MISAWKTCFNTLWAQEKKHRLGKIAVLSFNPIGSVSVLSRNCQITVTLLTCKERQSNSNTYRTGMLLHFSSLSRSADAGRTPPLASSEPWRSEANLCRTAYLTWGGRERLLAFPCTVLKGNWLFMGLVLLLLEVALLCPVIWLYPTRSHQYALVTTCCNCPAPTREPLSKESTGIKTYYFHS